MAKPVFSTLVNGLTDDTDIANSFATAFGDIGKSTINSRHDELKHEYYSLLNYLPSSTPPCIKAYEVAYYISKLKTNKSAGLDNISAEHLFYAHPIIHFLISLIFSACISSGYIPNNLTLGVVIPLLKSSSSDHTNTGNYRGITISSVFFKVFELFLSDVMADQLHSNDLQFGFKKTLAAEMQFSQPDFLLIITSVEAILFASVLSTWLKPLTPWMSSVCSFLYLNVVFLCGVSISYLTGTANGSLLLDGGINFPSNITSTLV